MSHRDAERQMLTGDVVIAVVIIAVLVTLLSTLVAHCYAGHTECRMCLNQAQNKKECSHVCSWQ